MKIIHMYIYTRNLQDGYKIIPDETLSRVLNVLDMNTDGLNFYTYFNIPKYFKYDEYHTELELKKILNLD